MSTNRSHFSRPERYSGSGFQHDSRETRYLDRTSQQTRGNLWDDAQENPSQFSHGSRTMSDRTQNYGGRGPKYGFQESRTDTTTYSGGGFRSSFRDESYEKDQRRDYFGAQSRGLKGMESERGNYRSGLEMNRFTNTATDTVGRFGMGLTGQTSSPKIEKDLSKFISNRSSTLSPMETESNRLDTFESRRQWRDIENPTNLLIESEGNSNRARGPYYQSQNEMRSEWSHESHRGQAAVPFRENEHYRFGDMSGHPSVVHGMEQGRDSSVPDTRAMQELRMRIAAEKQHSRENAVDMNKVMNVMKIVDQFSEEHRQKLSQSISAITSRSHRREEPAPHQESQGLKRGGSMYDPGDRDNSSFKRGRMEDFRDRSRSSSYEQSETWGSQQPRIQPKEKPIGFRRGREEDFRDRPRPSRYQQTETWGSQQPCVQPRAKPVPLLSLDLGVPDDDFPSDHETFRPKREKFSPKREKFRPKHETIRPKNESIESKLNRLMAGIRSFKASEDHVNDIHTIDVSLARCKMKSSYKEDELGKIGKKLTFTGSLRVNDVFLARSVGPTKKDAKRECHEKAMEVLMTYPVSKILKLKDEGIEELKMKLVAAEEKKKAEVVVAPAPPKPLQLHEKFEKIIHVLKNMKPAQSPVIELNNANVTTNLIFYREYKEEQIELWENYFLTKGLLKLDGHLIATAVGRSSKRVKHKTNAKGIEFLKYSPMSVILSGVQADDDYTNLYAHDVLSHRHVSLPDNETEQKLSRMIAAVKNMANFNQPASNILQVTSKNNHLLLTCLLKKKTRGAKQFSECDLYIDCIYVCSGEGCKSNDAMKKANEEAVRVLSNSSSELIFNDFKRITTQDVHDVAEVCEVWEGKKMKTFFWSNCAKIQLLKKQVLFKRHPDYKEFLRDWERMIVMEQDMFSSDRLNKAYEILLYTATKNFVTLFGKGTTDGNVLKCELFLQGEKLAEATGKSNLEASAKAAAKILFKLYQHQPVVKVLPEEKSKSWHTYESIKEKADKLKAESEESETDDFIYINDCPPRPKHKAQEDLMEVDQEDADDDAPSSGHSVSGVKGTDTVGQGDSFVDSSDTPSSTLPVNKWVKKVVEKMIAEYAETTNLEDLLFGPGFPSGDQRQIMLTASKNRIYSSFRTTPDKQGYVCVYQKLTPEMTQKTLKWKGDKCGKYALVPKEELPGLGDLATDSFGMHKNLLQSHLHKKRYQEPDQDQDDE